MHVGRNDDLKSRHFSFELLCVYIKHGQYSPMGTNVISESSSDGTPIIFIQTFRYGDFLKVSHNRYLQHTFQFTNIDMFNTIKANFPTALLQAIPINTCLRKSLSQITENQPSLSPCFPVQLSAAFLCEYLIVNNSR
jgi:hypothetical protein